MFVIAGAFRSYSSGDGFGLRNGTEARRHASPIVVASVQPLGLMSPLFEIVSFFVSSSLFSLVALDRPPWNRRRGIFAKETKVLLIHVGHA